MYYITERDEAPKGMINFDLALCHVKVVDTLQFKYEFFLTSIGLR